MKKLINDPENVVREELRGHRGGAHGDLVGSTIDPYYIVRATRRSRARWPSSRAAARATSRCTAASSAWACSTRACPGEVFTSPDARPDARRTKAVDGGAGVLHIVKNYTGDVMNFEMAAELARGEGIEVESVLVDDDVAVQDSLYTAGRRGVGATVLAGEDRRRGGRGTAVR